MQYININFQTLCVSVEVADADKHVIKVTAFPNTMCIGWRKYFLVLSILVFLFPNTMCIGWRNTSYKLFTRVISFQTLCVSVEVEEKKAKSFVDTSSFQTLCVSVEESLPPVELESSPPFPNTMCIGWSYFITVNISFNLLFPNTMCIGWRLFKIYIFF